MVRFMKLAGLFYMILIMVLYFTFIDVMKEFEAYVGRTWATIILTIISISGFLSLMSLMKRSSSAKIITDKKESDVKIDFSQNSPTVPREEAREVKPIDLTGNVFEHNEETLKDDLAFLDQNKSEGEE